MAPFRVALVQCSPPPHVDAICEEAESWIAHAASQDAQLVLFPELFYPGFHGLMAGWRGDEEALRSFLDSAHPIPGPVSDEVGRIAKRHEVHVVFTQLESDEHSKHLYNASLLTGPDGSLILRHRKTMLTPGVETFGLAPGNEHRVAATALGNVGLLICADATCPEPARVLALQGADIVCVSSGDFHSTWRVDGSDLAQQFWTHCSASPTRAVDNNVFWLVVNPAGNQGGSEFFGGSRIISPLGQLIAQAGCGADAQELLVAEIDVAQRNRIEASFSLLRRRRPELYGEISRIPGSSAG